VTNGHYDYYYYADYLNLFGRRMTTCSSASATACAVGTCPYDHHHRRLWQRHHCYHCWRWPGSALSTCWCEWMKPPPPAVGHDYLVCAVAGKASQCTCALSCVTSASGFVLYFVECWSVFLVGSPAFVASTTMCPSTVRTPPWTTTMCSLWLAVRTVDSTTTVRTRHNIRRRFSFV